MADDQGEKEEQKFEFDSAGEALGYISLDQARVLAMRTAREAPGGYGRRFRNIPMAFEVVEDNETEDHYMVTLSFRPQGQFAGAPGQEQFFIEKEGAVAHRQVLSLPRPAGGRRFPVVPVAIGLAAVAILAVVGVVLAAGGLGGGEGDGSPVAVAVPTTTPAPAPTQVLPSPTPVPLALIATPTPLPMPTPAPTLGVTSEPTLAVAPPPTDTPTAVPIPEATPTALPTPTATPRPAQGLPPSESVVRELGISDGVHYGTAAILGAFDLGSGTQSFSVAVPPFQGYFYGTTDFADPPVFFAEVVGPPSACDILNYSGYMGFSSPHEVRNAAALTFTSIDAILFGTRKSTCYEGMLVFRQGSQYGIIDPIEMDPDFTLHINWWLGEPNLVDFSVAPSQAPGAEQGSPTFVIDIKDFTHQDLTVPAGTTVVWTNLDRVQHTVTSGSPSDPDPGALFDSGSNQADWLTQGETDSVTFNQAGVFSYFCAIHPSMTATVTVTPVEPVAVAPTPMVVTTEANIQGFAHQDLTVPAGTTVVWTNRDGASHTTTAEEGQWDSGTLQEGESFSFTFAEAGVFSYFCAIHPSMTAQVTVNN